MKKNGILTSGGAAERIPQWMKTEGGSPLYFLDLRDRGVDLDDPGARTRVAGILEEIHHDAAPEHLSGPAIIKSHIGEPLIETSIIPRLAASTVDFLKSRGIKQAAFGDTTVLYSSGRGGKENPHGREKAYLDLARKRGWGDLEAPFVVLDRPATSAPGVFEFEKGAITLEAGPPGRYANVFAAGAVDTARSFFQHAHMTGHMLTGLACCIKGIAMGMANRRGKSQMHLSLLPRINDELCDRCGKCAERCPEEALDFTPGEVPRLDEKRCLGCGQCMAECEQKAIDMKGLESYAGYDWGRGSDTIHARMTDYAVGLMQRLWDSSLHIAHMVRMTPSCDCYNRLQTPMCDDIGFIVGKNPFAVDYAATEMLIERTSRYADNDVHGKINTFRMGDPSAYAYSTYGIVSKAEIITIPFTR